MHTRFGSAILLQECHTFYNGFLLLGSAQCLSLPMHMHVDMMAAVSQALWHGLKPGSKQGLEFSSRYTISSCIAWCCGSGSIARPAHENCCMAKPWLALQTWSLVVSDLGKRATVGTLFRLLPIKAWEVCERLPICYIYIYLVICLCIYLLYIHIYITIIYSHCWGWP